MTQVTLYTVVTGKKSCLVKYAQSPAYETKLFSGSFNDFGEASQEFKKSFKDSPEYLTETAFERKVDKLSTRHKQDLVKLQAWNTGKAIRI